MNRRRLGDHLYLYSLFLLPLYGVACVSCLIFGENPFKFFPVISMAIFMAFIIGLGGYLILTPKEDG